MWDSSFLHKYIHAFAYIVPAHQKEIRSFHLYENIIHSQMSWSNSTFHKALPDHP